VGERLVVRDDRRWRVQWRGCGDPRPLGSWGVVGRRGLGLGLVGKGDAILTCGRAWRSWGAGGSGRCGRVRGEISGVRRGGANVGNFVHSSGALEYRGRRCPLVFFARLGFIILRQSPKTCDSIFRQSFKTPDGVSLATST
jgi:hypothetical protein